MKFAHFLTNPAHLVTSLPRDRKSGGALFLVIFVTAIIGIILPSMMMLTNTELRLNTAAVRHSRATYAAESVLEHGFAQTDLLVRSQSHYDRFFLTRDGGVKSPETTEIEADRGNGGWEVKDTELHVGMVPLGERRFIDPADTANAFDELRGQYVTSRHVMLLSRATVSHPILGQSTAHAQQYLEIRDSPLFAYAIFYDDIMGLTPGSHTQIFGPVHCNAHIVLEPWNGLDFFSQVNTFDGYQRVGGSFTFLGRNGGQFTPEFTLSDDETTGWWDTFNFPAQANFVFEFGRIFGENLRTQKHDLRQVHPPAFGDLATLDDGSPGLHRIIQAPLRRSDPRLDPGEWDSLTSIENEKFSTKAGLVISVDVRPAPIPALADLEESYDGTQLVLAADGRILYPTRVIRFDDNNRPVKDAHGNYVYVPVPPTATREWFDPLHQQQLLVQNNNNLNISPWEARHAFLHNLYTEGQRYEVSIRAFRYEPSDSGEFFRNGEPHERVDVTHFIPNLHLNAANGIFRTHYFDAGPGGEFQHNTGRNFDAAGQDRITRWVPATNQYKNYGPMPTDLLPDGTPPPRQLWDSRRRQWVYTVDLDIGNLKAALDNDQLPDGWNGIVFVEFLHNGQPIEDTFQDVRGNLFPYQDRAFLRSGLRVVNAREVPTTFGPDELPDGFTLATNNVMYIKGSFNADGDLATGTAQEPDVLPPPASLSEVPAALIADAVVILSDNWNDAMSRADVYRSRGGGDHTPNHRAIPTDIEIAAAIITGMTPGDERPWDTRTRQFAHNGGPLNQLRLMEFFGPTFTTRFRGSLVQLYHNAVAWEPWGLRYIYHPPSREIGFADTFANGRYPPGTPTTRSFQRAIYRPISPAKFNAFTEAFVQAEEEDWSDAEYNAAIQKIYTTVQ